MRCLLRRVICVIEICKHQSTVFTNGRQTRCMNSVASKSKETELVRQLKAKIKLAGPITVAEYMQETLSNPLAGYYMSKDVFGVQGDFITSPEVSQMFGELIGIWFYDRWLQNGSPQSLNLVELGPGRGTLISDILRVFAKLGKISDSLSLHLVEISPRMRDMQKRLLCPDVNSQEMSPTDENTAVTRNGIHVTWHKNILDVPNGWTHERKNVQLNLSNTDFEGTEPNVRIREKTQHGWREILVDIDENDGPHHLKFVLAPAVTPATILIPEENEGAVVEIRPQIEAIAGTMATTIHTYGGCSLIVDYGEEKCGRHTLRAFNNHELTDPLSEPGHSDLTSNVDFSHLKRVFQENGVATFGPTTQRSFLKKMGIDMRKEVLLKKASFEQAKDIETAYTMLTDESEMGNCFKIFTAAMHKASERPPGF